MTEASIIRAAKPGDADALCGLLAQLGYGAIAAEVTERLRLLEASGDRILVAEREGVVRGVLTLHVRHALHRARPVGALTVMVVDEAARGAGLGRRLVEAAEAILAAAGCGTIEVTSNRARTGAHAFYERLGYETTSITLRKDLR